MRLGGRCLTALTLINHRLPISDAIEDYLTFWDVAVFFGVPLGPLI
jgi:hypothetical protein